MSVLTTRERNRALLARQLLLERTTSPLPRAVEKMGGVQAQYAPSTYIGLWSRVEALEREQITRALERRTLVQASLLRSTIHVVSKQDYWYWSEAIREPMRRWFARVHPAIKPAQSQRAAGALRKALVEGPRTRDELIALVGKDGWLGAGLYVNLVRVPPSGTWEKRRADLYGLAVDWVGPCDVTAQQGVELLVRRYLGAFGPARPADIRQWGGLASDDVKDALARMQLRRFRDEQDRELVDLPRAPLPDSETPAPPRFIPTWDAMLLVHARATGVLPEEYRPLVFDTKTPHSMPTFLVDGFAAGAWRIERAKEKATLRLEPFAPLPRAARRELVEEGERLVRWHEDDALSYSVR